MSSIPGSAWSTPSLLTFRCQQISTIFDLSATVHVAYNKLKGSGDKPGNQVLRQIRSISRSVSQPVVQSLIVSLFVSRLDYGSATLGSLPACQLDRLQSVVNTAARLIYRSRKFDHVMPLLHNLHWLRIPERITFRLAVLAYRCQNGLAPKYLTDDLHQVAEVESRRRLRSAALIVPATARSTIGDCAYSCRCRSGVEQPLALGYVISVLPVFRKLLKTVLFTHSFFPS